MKILIALGKGYKGVTKKNEYAKLSLNSKITALAAGIAYKNGLFDKIVFSEGKTAGENNPSVASEMKRYLLRWYPEILDSNVLLEENSIDTAGNVIELSELGYISKYNLAHVLSLGFHLNRSLKLFKNIAKVPALGYAAEKEVERSHRRHLTSFIKRYQKSNFYRIELIKEMILRFIFFFDRKGKKLKFATKLIRRDF